MNYLPENNTRLNVLATLSGAFATLTHLFIYPGSWMVASLIGLSVLTYLASYAVSHPVSKVANDIKNTHSTNENSSEKEQAYIINQYIDSAVTEWKKAGTPVHYLNSLVDVPDKQKADIYHAASLRHKRREPKSNPYLANEE